MTSLPSILSHTIPHNVQEYDTAGNYFNVGNVWHVRITQMGDWRYEAMLLMHELTEMLLTTKDGVDWSDIDLFDREGAGKDHPDPGSLEAAPYHKQHLLAEEFERRLGELLGVDWTSYNVALDALEYRQ